MKLSKFFLVVGFLLGVSFFYISGGKDYVSLNFLREQLVGFQDYYKSFPIQAGFIFFAVYLFVTSLSLPGAAVLSLLGGAIFGSWIGLLVVSFASTLGSLLSFLAARFLFRDYFVNKFRRQFLMIDKSFSKEGSLYLASLRLIPLFPFFLINILMGLTSIRAFTFYWVSQLCMLPGTVAYVYAGREFSQITNLKGILSPNVLFAFTLLGFLPLIGKLIFSQIKKNTVYKKFNKPKKYDYNLVAIGGGAAGLVTSYIGAAVKSKVALIEKHKMGGDCLNTGCVPSKALIKSAKVIHFQKRAKDFGLKKVNVDFDFSEVMERVQGIITKIEPHDSIERYTSLGVDCIEGRARILDPWRIEVNGKILTTQNIVVATGARPFIPHVPGINEADYVTSENLWSTRTLPKKLIVLGGGPVGVEMAQAFSRLGSEVTIILAGERILSKEDPKIAQMMADSLMKEGVRILSFHKLVRFENQNGKIIVCENESKEIQIPYDLVLIAMGRKANTTGFGLEELGVTIRENGTIEANEYLQTNFPNIYVCGDVTGPYQLTHMASHQAWYCAINSLFPKKFKADYSVVPWCTYSDPEVATVGENETTAQEKGLSFEITEYDISDLDRAIAEGEVNGIVRVITEKGKDKILGATIVSSQASSMILEFISAMKNKKGLNSILGTIHVYPSFGEANKYAAGVWKRGHVNHKILKYLEKYFKWTRNE
jgi:dihydrolipoamide dehydrogenase